MTDRKTLDQMNSDDLDQLHERLRKAERAANLLANSHRRVDRAEAAIARVREAADQLADGTEAGFRAALAIREALAEPAPTASPAATEATDGQPCTCGGRFPIHHLHADRHQPAELKVAPAGPDTVTDPAYLREQYAAAIRDHGLMHLDERVFTGEHDCCADAVLHVRDRHVEQLRQRLALADQARREDADTWQQRAEQRSRVIDDEQAKRREAEVDLRRAVDRVEEAERQRDQLASTLAEVLARFTREGHPGEPCLKTHWIPVKTVDRWRAALNPPKEQPDE